METSETTSGGFHHHRLDADRPCTRIGAAGIAVLGELVILVTSARRRFSIVQETP